jgi:hypothetical protein
MGPSFGQILMTKGKIPCCSRKSNPNFSIAQRMQYNPSDNYESLKNVMKNQGKYLYSFWMASTSSSGRKDERVLYY